MPIAVDAVGAVAALGRVRRARSPSSRSRPRSGRGGSARRTVSGWFTPQLSRRPASPRARTAPASAPRTSRRPSDGHEPRAVVRVGALEDVDAEVACACTPIGLRLLPATSRRCPGTCASGRSTPSAAAARGDADVVDDPALADDRVVAARRRGRVVGPVVEQHAVDVGPVVEAEVHRVVERAGAAATAAGTLFATIFRPTASQPLSTDDRIGWNSCVGLRRPVGELRARAVVVPVVVLAGVARSAPCARAS